MSTKKIKRLLILCLAILLCLSIVGSSVMIALGDENQNIENNKPIFAENGDNIMVEGEKVFEIWKAFQEAHPNRTGATDFEVEAANYLAEQFAEIGVEKVNDNYIKSFSKFIDKNDGTGTMSYSQNVVGMQKSKTSNGKQVIIGASYDNGYGVPASASSEGASGNGSSVAVVLALAEVLKNYEFDFDIVYVFFGMEAQGNYGSEHHFYTMTEAEKVNTLLMVNFDSVITGDYLYAFSDEIPRLHEDIFFQNSEELGENILVKTPTDKKSLVVLGEKPFLHVANDSDNATFINGELNTISFLGYNFTTELVMSGAEKDGEVNVLDTKNDNVNYIVNLYGMEHITSRFENVVNVVANTLTDPNFASEMINSKENPTVANIFYNRYFITAVGIAVFALFILGVYLLNKKASKEIPEKFDQQPKATVNEQDIFNMFETIKKQQQQQQRGQQNTQKKDDDDDIFG